MSHLPLLGLAFFIYAIYLCGVPNKAVKKEKKKDAEKMHNK